jgi:hypothetical protein
VLAADAGRPAAAPEAARTTPPIESVREAMRQGDFRGQSVVAVLPREWVQVKTLACPYCPRTTLNRPSNSNPARLFTTPGRRAFRAIRRRRRSAAGAPSRSWRRSFLAVEQKRIEDMLERFNQIGLYVAAFDFEPCSVYAAFPGSSAARPTRTR